MVTGLASVGNQQYYFNQSGAMQTGWIQADGTYYYANNSGYIQKGWLHKGSWYYLDQDGKMATGLVSVGDEQCYFDQSGAMKQDGSKQMEHIIMRIIMVIFKKDGYIKDHGIIWIKMENGDRISFCRKSTILF